MSGGGEGASPASGVAGVGGGATGGKVSRLWLWFVAAFVLQLGAWAAWFAIAAKNKVAEVPLATAPAKR